MSNAMKYELTKTESPMFSEYYTGYNPESGVTVHCILADNCVRYVVYDCKARRMVKRREYDNHEKSRCMANATAALNR